MKELFNYVSVISVAAVLFACGNSEDVLNGAADGASNVEVVSLSDYLPQSSRAAEMADGAKVLKFKDKEAYSRTIAELNSMDENQRLEYFEELGFDGAYTLQRKADAELEAIFDDESLDSCAFYREIAAYINKYDGMFCFHKEDETDVTPNLKFEDDNMALVGTIDGYAVIGDKLVGASTMAAEPTGPISVNLEIVKTCEVSVKNGKYTSYLSLGRIENHFAFKTQTYRKKFVSTKYDNDVVHIGDVAVKELTALNNGFSTHIDVKGKATYRLPVFLNSKLQKWDVQFTNFYSSKHPENKASKTFNNIAMK